MMIDPETYYELFLKGKTREDIYKSIGSLKRTIKSWKKALQTQIRRSRNLFAPAKRCSFLCIRNI